MEYIRHLQLNFVWGHQGENIYYSTFPRNLPDYYSPDTWRSFKATPAVEELI